MAENAAKLLAQTLQRLPAVEKAREKLDGKSPAVVNFAGLDGAAKALLALGLGEGRPLLYIASDNLALRRLEADISALLGRPVPVLHAAASDMLGSGTRSRLAEMERLAALSAFLQDPNALLLADGRALFDRLPLPAELSARSLLFERGELYQRRELLDRLAAAGYERCRQVEAPGQMAVRGDLIDLGLEPAPGEGKGEALGLRLSFFDTELEDLRLFDPVNQRSLESLVSRRVPALREQLPDKESRCRLAGKMRACGEESVKELLRNGGEKAAVQAIRELVREDAEQLEEGTESGGLERWDFLLHPERANLLDYARERRALVVVDEAADLRARLDAAQAEFYQEAENLLLRHKAIPAFYSTRCTPPELMKQLAETPFLLSLAQIPASGNAFPGGISLQSGSHSAERYRGRERFLFSDLKHWREQSWTILLCAPGERRRERLREILNEESMTLPLSSMSLGEGFVWPEAKLAVLGEVNLFGSEKKKVRKQREGTPIRFFSELHPGDLVVHDEHGIGCYKGIETLDAEGARRDYLRLEYAGGDVLFLPVERLDDIQKYLAGENRKPKLSRLGGKDWEKQKTKARESIRKLATDLLKVYALRQAEKGHAFSADTVWQEQFEEAFPFAETEDQLRALSEIKADMESDKIMDRLLCGDVGFGKTELAFRALFKAVMDGKQGALIAPTTVLAQQHYESFKQRLADFPLRLRLLTRFISGERKTAILKELRQGEADLVIGTHRLLSQDIRFKDLGLLVIDEEQRFGVDHKETLKDRYSGVDVLTMTATPIPRTLHMSMTGLRDISVLENGPEDRRPVQTYVMEYDTDLIDEAMLREISRGGQVFYLFNDTRKLSQKAAEIMERLPGARVTWAHGQMSERVLENAVSGFSAGDFDILVCTTIIESGIDMPNVNTIIVEDADRLGLAQLYQIRGRVGRSERQAYAYICYRKDKILSEDAGKRLAAIRDYTELGSGFRIALRDLEVRGAGNLLGGEQSGHLDAIGYDLYCRMLEQAIQELRGEKVLLPEANCLIDLPVDALIPGSYIEDEGERMDLYRRALGIGSAEDWQDVLDELIDRYGNPPQGVMNLLDIALTRVQASGLGIERIELRDRDLILYLAAGRAADARLMQLFQKESAQGRLLFNAGLKPFILYKNAAVPADSMAEKLRKLFL